jgi:type I site-specific restriction endonuclease
MNEAKTRAELIDLVLRAAGWGISAIVVEFQQHLYSQDNLA